MKKLIINSMLAVFAFSPLAYSADPSAANISDSSNNPVMLTAQLVESAPIRQDLLEDIQLPTDNSNTGSKDPYYRSQVLLKSPGKMIASGTNNKPVGALKLKTYQLEEITLPEAWDVKVEGQNRLVTKAWRLTIVGGPFPVRDMPAFVWIDNKFLAYGDSTEKGLVAIVYDSSVFTNGAEIAISYGENGMKSKLTERLFYKGLL